MDEDDEAWHWAAGIQFVSEFVSFLWIPLEKDPDLKDPQGAQGSEAPRLHQDHVDQIDVQSFGSYDCKIL